MRAFLGFLELVGRTVETFLGLVLLAIIIPLTVLLLVCLVGLWSVFKWIGGNNGR